MKEITKVLAISVAFFAFFLLFGLYNYSTLGHVNASIDFQFHLEKIHDLSLHPEYPPFYHILFIPLGFNEFAFYAANIFLICVLIPFFLYKGTKTWWAVIIYFAGVSLPHMWIYGATYPQALAFFFLILYLANRDKPKYVIFLVLVILIHREGIYLIGLIAIAKLLEFLYNKLLSSKALPAVVLGVQKFPDAAHFVFFVLSSIAFPLVFFSKKFLQKPFWLVLIIVPLFLLNIDARIITITQLAIIFAISEDISKSKHKRIICVTCTIYLTYFLLDFCLGTQSMLKQSFIN